MPFQFTSLNNRKIQNRKYETIKFIWISKVDPNPVLKVHVLPKKKLVEVKENHFSTIVPFDLSVCPPIFQFLYPLLVMFFKLNTTMIIKGLKNKNNIIKCANIKEI